VVTLVTSAAIVLFTDDEPAVARDLATASDTDPTWGAITALKTAPNRTRSQAASVGTLAPVPSRVVAAKSSSGQDLPSLLANTGASSQAPGPQSDLVPSAEHKDPDADVRVSTNQQRALKPDSGEGELAGNPLQLKFGPGKTGVRSANKFPVLKPVRIKVKSGDSLYGILKRRGLPPAVLPALLSVGKLGKRLELIKPGQALDFYIDKQGDLQRLEYRPDRLTTVSYRRDGDRFATTLTETPLDRRERTVSGAIESSLFLDGQRAGLSDRTIMRMAEIFGWDVDFALDIRDGDRFTVVFEELLDGGSKVRDGDILAAEFINRGRVYQAVRFLSPGGETQYYTPDGRSMRKAFLRTPVRFARISSKFNLRRKHPILHKVRAHRGVDYAAPSGTPIRATGDGRIDFLGRKSGYGKTVTIRHSGGNYSTLYAHMKGFARKLRSGSHVKQGQVIGYVGKTGLATGPHLHYEFRVRGVHKDPLSVRLPKSLPIASRHRSLFQRQTRKLLSKLNNSGATVAGRD
jgi:murein DD-endopeptidase MepM/ murein hydrolase activator NlpD